ncbi:MAG: hypothetical protein ACRC1P_05220 [Cellulosilyticaceae bacterium]
MYKKYVIKEFNTAEEIFIKANETFKYQFNLGSEWKERLQEHQFKLRILGDQGVHPSWMWEGGYPYLYRMIDDALCQETTHHSQFSLKVKMNHENYRKRVYYKIKFPASITPQFSLKKEDSKLFKFRIYVKTEALKYQPEGKVEVVFEKRLKRENISPEAIDYPADEIIRIPVEEGTADWKVLERIFECEEEIANILVYITAEYGEGTIYFEDASFLSQEGHNLLPQFTVSNPYHEYLNWLGENLSRKEWTDLEIKINGQVCFDGEVFQRTHRWSEKEIQLLGEVLQLGENEISISNKSNYFAPYPYKLKSIQLLFAPYEKVNIIAYPKIVRVGQEVPILIDLKDADDEIVLESESEILMPVQKKYKFDKEGLQVVKVKVLEHGTQLVINIRCKETCKKIIIERTVVKEHEDVLTGTGDAIYVPQDCKEIEDFLGWYMNNEIGNFITFRPVYRWCGSRVLNESYWDRVVELCNELGLYYCHMVDGREFPGMNANPTKKMLEGEYFVGKQGHERDGAYFYWGSKKQEHDRLYTELYPQLLEHEDFKYILPPKYEGSNLYTHFSPEKCKDMEEAAQYYVENAKESLTGIKRHSGPSVLFKYFYQAGLENVGGELMYGPHEVIIAAQRGAAIAYNKKEHLAHLAVQWSTTPHDTIERFRRYQLALFICYTHGVHHINTEEGLWRMEEYFSYHDRFDEACKGHQNVQRDFNHFVSTHSRKGEMINPIALVHGKNDGWVCFTRRSPWAHEGEEWQFNTPEESWDLIKVFYPDSVLNAIYRHPCENEPQGFYTRTPYGPVDILPIEAEVECYKKYPAMAFIGWNTAEELQVEKLIEYVKDGGRLVLSWCHLFATKLRKGALSGTSTFVEDKYIQELLGISSYAFGQEEEGIRGATLTLAKEATVKEYAGDYPLVIEHILGKGKVTFVNTKCFPADPSIRDTYEKVLENLAQEIATGYEGKGYIATSDTVNFTVYDQEDGLRKIYLVNINWWEQEKSIAQAELKWKEARLEIEVPRERINILTLSETLGVYTTDNETEVLNIVEGETEVIIRLQGIGETCIEIIHPWQRVASDEIKLETISDQRSRLTMKLEGITEIKLHKVQ